MEATHFSRAMAELGIQQIFARSPQAKGRVERAARTFRDRLVTELRLSGVKTIAQANAVLRDFLPRYNAQSAVPAELSDLAYRPWAGNRPLDEILCFKHPRKVARDYTVKYRWRTPQLLPRMERPSYAGVQVEVLDTPTGASRCGMRARSSPLGQFRPDVVRCAPLTEPRPPLPKSVASRNVWATTASVNPSCDTWPTWSPIPSSQMTTMSATLNANPKPRRNGRCPRASWHCGRQCSRPRCRASRYARSHDNWAYLATPYASTPVPSLNPPTDPTTVASDDSPYSPPMARTDKFALHQT